MIVYGVVASPRKGKNTDLLVEKALQGASKAGAQTKKININDLDIKPCLACDRRPEDYCLIKDDMEIIYKMLETADGIIIGTPVYYGSVPGPMKTMIDRCGCLSDLKSGAKKIAKKKKALLVITADLSTRFGDLTRLISLWSKDVNLKIIDRIIVTKTTSQPVKDRPMLLKFVRDKGESLAKAIISRGGG